jgi:hypothetical protein
MVRTMNILLTGAVFSNLILGLVSTDEHQRVLQRRADVSDMSPLSDEESKSFKNMVKRGALKIGDSTKKPSKKGKPVEARRRLKSSKKGGDKQGNSNAQTAPTSHQATGSTGQTAGRSGAPPKQASGPSPQTTGRSGAPPKQASGPPPQTTRHHDNDDYSMGDDTSYYDDYFNNYDDNYYYDDQYYYEDSADYTGKGKGGSDYEYVKILRRGLLFPKCGYLTFLFLWNESLNFQ